MKRERGILTVLLTICLLLTACQPTPEEEIVTNKGDGIMEEKIFASAPPNTISVEGKEPPATAPVEKITHWTERFKVNDDLLVEIDCDVDHGTGAPYYVEQCEPKKVTPEMVVEIGNLFYEDITGLREQEVSYDELLNELMELERGYYNGKNEDGTPIWSPHDKKYKKEHTAEIKAQMENTPAESTYVPFEASNVHLHELGNTTLTVMRENGEESTISTFIGTNSSYHISCNKWKDAGMWLEEHLLQERLFEHTVNELPEPKITEEEAKEKAVAFLASIGMGNSDCSYATKAKLGTVSETYSEGWCLFCAPALQGTRGVNLLGRRRHGLFRLEDAAGGYIQSYEPESITLYVTEKGVELLEWQYLYEVNEVTNENVEILPFESIQESIRKYFNLAFSWVSDSTTKKMLVKEIVLTSSFVQIKDDTEHAYRIPTWAISYIGDDEEREYSWTSVMLINAIDGTLIYR